jgi:uncharacterized protein
MKNSKRIFIDTSGWIELILSGEIHHKEVSSYFTNEVKKDSKFFTSDYVLDESFTRLLINQNFHTAKILREKTKQAQKEGQLLTFWTDEVLFNKTWDFFTKYKDHNLSFTDANTAILVRQYKLDEILTLDLVFKKAGFSIKPTLR